jgi:hypothetical protein
MHSSHLAGAVKRVKAGERVVLPDLAPARNDDGNTGTGHPRVVVNERGVTDENARNIGDGIMPTGGQRTDPNAQVA